MTETLLNTHNVVVNFGRHNGELLTRIPVSYLRWLSNQTTGEWKDLAAAELTRRGSDMPEVELSRHAIDRASLRVRKTWHQSSNPDEGLASWLERMVLEALQNGEAIGDDAYIYNGMKLVITHGSHTPILKTVIPVKEATP